MWSGTAQHGLHRQQPANGVTAVQASQGRFYDYLDANTQNASISWRNSMPATGGFAPSMVHSILQRHLTLQKRLIPSIRRHRRTIHLLRSKPQRIQRRNRQSPMVKHHRTDPQATSPQSHSQAQTQKQVTSVNHTDKHSSS